MIRYRVLKQPRVGDSVDVHVGPSRVTRVHRYGVVLDVVDAIGRTWTVERAPHGHWAVLP